MYETNYCDVVNQSEHCHKKIIETLSGKIIYTLSGKNNEFD